MYVKDKGNFQSKEKLMKDWYEERSRIIFQESLNKMYSLVKSFDIKKPSLEMRQMTKRWGSYLERSNKIILNRDLIIAPKFCIDRSEEHTSELQSRGQLVCRLLLEKKKKK